MLETMRLERFDKEKDYLVEYEMSYADCRRKIAVFILISGFLFVMAIIA